MIKLICTFIGVEPRLLERLPAKLNQLLLRCKAKSVEIELIREILKKFKESEELYQNAVERLDSFLLSKDNNLLYLGLASLKEVIKHNPPLIASFKDKITNCFQSTDMTIRKRALHVINALANEENF